MIVNTTTSKDMCDTCYKRADFEISFNGEMEFICTECFNKAIKPYGLVVVPLDVIGE